jgi:hypothetical protein
MTRDRLTVNVRFLADPVLWAWCWEVQGADGRAIESSWESRWIVYESVGDAVVAGLRRLADLTRYRHEAPGQMGVRHLVIVARGGGDLYESLSAAFSGEPCIEVVRDRRIGERRRRQEPCSFARRLADRRSRPELEARISSGGWVVVTVPEAVALSAA